MRNRHDTSGIWRRHQTDDPPSLLGVLMLGLALFALVLPIVGPLDDHHFAERSHSHEHIYLDGQPVAHEHVSDAGQLHRHSPALVGIARITEEPGDNGIAYLTHPAATPFLTILTAPWNRAPDAMRPTVPTVKDINHLFPFALVGLQPNGLRVAPPVPPPVA